MNRFNIRTPTMLLGLVLLAIAGAMTAWLLHSERDARRWVSHTTQVRERLADYRITALRSELALRGYVITGNRADLAAYMASAGRDHDKLESIRRLVSDNAVQRQRLDELEGFVAERRRTSETALDLRRTGRMADAGALIDSAPVRDRAVRMVHLIEKIWAEEARLDGLRQKRASLLEDATLTILVGSAFILLLVIGVAMQDRRYRIKALERANGQLATDIARRQAVERELALLAENATDAVFRVGLDGRFLYASPSVLEVIGVPPDRLIGKSLFASLHPEDEIAVFTALHRLRSGEAEYLTLSYRVSLPSDPGKWIWLEASTGTIRDAGGQPLEIIASLRNVSLRKQLEQDLREARNAAEAAASAKSNFLANMSHEIRTPMNGVVGFADLLLASDLSADQRQYAQLIADSGAAMTRLLNDILDLSKIDAEQMTIASERFDLLRTLEACAKLISPALMKKQLTLECDIDPALPRIVIGDALRLRQILLNLLGNAAKFTERGSVILRARPVAVDGGAQVAIEVEDSGVGIPADRQAAVLDPFVQADDGTAARFGGTGLGLPISAKLAQLMGGSLELASEPGFGTLVRVILPLDVDDEAEPHADETGTMADAARMVRSDLRVLVAEDHDVNQVLISAMLRQLRCRVDIAGDGAQAVAMARAAAQDDPYAIVLMDLQLPEMDGLEATRRIRACGLTSDVLPIVALTANAYADDIAACLDAGMQAHIGKPFRVTDLERALATWAGRTAGQAQPAGEPIQAPPSVHSRYLKRKAETLEKLEHAAKLTAFDDAVFDELAELLHKLAGTAGMFGEAKLGDRARDLEKALRRCDPQQRPEALAQAMPELRRAA